ncbi:MAG: hypothetical protein K2W99_03345 [Chthoniobacterales bacterium]|nr:hypothetical protein [Chthoniobacterales bacterium]
MEEENLSNLDILEQRTQEARKVIADLGGKGTAISEKELRELYQKWSNRYERYKEKADVLGRANNIGTIAGQQIEDRLTELVQASCDAVEALRKSLLANFQKAFHENPEATRLVITEKGIEPKEEIVFSPNTRAENRAIRESFLSCVASVEWKEKIKNNLMEPWHNALSAKELNLMMRAIDCANGKSLSVEEIERLNDLSGYDLLELVYTKIKLPVLRELVAAFKKNLDELWKVIGNQGLQVISEKIKGATSDVMKEGKLFFHYQKYLLSRGKALSTLRSKLKSENQQEQKEKLAAITKIYKELTLVGQEEQKKLAQCRDKVFPEMARKAQERLSAFKQLLSPRIMPLQEIGKMDKQDLLNYCESKEYKSEIKQAATHVGNLETLKKELGSIEEGSKQLERLEERSALLEEQLKKLIADQNDGNSEEVGLMQHDLESTEQEIILKRSEIECSIKQAQKFFVYQEYLASRKRSFEDVAGATRSTKAKAKIGDLIKEYDGLGAFEKEKKKLAKKLMQFRDKFFPDGVNKPLFTPYREELPLANSIACKDALEQLQQIMNNAQDPFVLNAYEDIVPEAAREFIENCLRHKIFNEPLVKALELAEKCENALRELVGQPSAEVILANIEKQHEVTEEIFKTDRMSLFAVSRPKLTTTKFLQKLIDAFDEIKRKLRPSDDEITLEEREIVELMQKYFSVVKKIESDVFISSNHFSPEEIIKRWAEPIIERIKNKGGTPNLFEIMDGYPKKTAVSTKASNELGKLWVGPNYYESNVSPRGPNSWGETNGWYGLESADGLRRYRFPSDKFKGSRQVQDKKSGKIVEKPPFAWTGCQSNFEWRKAINPWVEGNIHLDVF